METESWHAARDKNASVVNTIEWSMKGEEQGSRSRANMRRGEGVGDLSTRDTPGSDQKIETLC